MIQARAQSAGATSGTAGVFLHAGWRSCGTWMWERLRENAGIRGFYEPLHEDLATLRPREIGLLRPDSWKSGHGNGAPYFAEFGPLLRAGGGVRNYAGRFAFDQYFADTGTDDRALEAYLRGLMASARAENRLPVMKFCRSLGRVPWMEARFPDVFHAIILRNPEAQWLSARRQMEQNKNRYFVLAPFVILALNAENPLLADATARLRVRMPPRLGRNLGITTDACWRHVQRLTWQERFRGFLALWVTTGISSLASKATLIDADRLAADAEHRLMSALAMQAALGVPVDLMPDAQGNGAAGAQAIGSAVERRDAERAKAAALGFIEAHGHTLKPDRAAALRQKLAPCTAGQGELDDQCVDDAALQPGLADYVDAATYVALTRATYPLRRGHYHVRRWLGRA